MSESLSLLSWNVESGGFESYASDAEPTRQQAVQDFVHTVQETHGVRAASLLDTHRWDDTFGSEEGIASYLGFAHARHTRLEDSRLDGNGQAIGVTFATDEKIAQSEVLDLGTRNALGTILDIGAHGLQVATVYLDDLHQERREDQIKELLEVIEKDIPTVLVGDFNMLRPSSKTDTLMQKSRDTAIRSMAKLLLPSPKRTTIVGLNKRTGVEKLTKDGFIDADEQLKRPTALSWLHIFGVDYVFHKDVESVGPLKVLPTQKVSDHSALVVDLKV